MKKTRFLFIALLLVAAFTVAVSAEAVVAQIVCDNDNNWLYSTGDYLPIAELDDSVAKVDTEEKKEGEGSISVVASDTSFAPPSYNVEWRVVNNPQAWNVNLENGSITFDFWTDDDLTCFSVSQLEIGFGEPWDKDELFWDMNAQFIFPEAGWNEITLAFADGQTVGNVDFNNITYIRLYGLTVMQGATMKLDNIRIINSELESADTLVYCSNTVADPAMAEAPAAAAEEITEFGAELIGKFEFEGNTANVVPGGDQPASNGVTYVEGRTGQAGFFNKASMELPLEFVTETDGITLSMWTKWDWYNNYDRLIEFYAEGDSETLAFWVCPITNSGCVEALLYDPLGGRTVGIADGKTQIPMEEWVNITLVAGEGDGNYRLYVNGVLTASGTIAAPLSDFPFTKVCIGGQHYYGNTITDLYLDDVYFFDGMLTDAEVASLVAYGYATPEAPAVEEPVVEEPVVEEPVVEEPVVEAPVVDEAPKTADAIVVLAVAALVSGSAAVISKKRR